MIEFNTQELLAIIGLLAVIFFALFLVFLALGVIFVYVLSKNKRIMRFLSSTVGVWISKRIMFILGLVYSPSKKIISLIGGNPKMVDLVHVELANMLLRKSFSLVPFKDRIVVVPQCLRSLECPASFHSVEGAKCIKCGKCKVFKITQKAEELGYKGTYIAPGGGFVKRIIKKVPKQYKQAIRNK